VGSRESFRSLFSLVGLRVRIVSAPLKATPILPAPDGRVLLRRAIARGGEHALGVGTISSVAKKLNIHKRNTLPLSAPAHFQRPESSTRVAARGLFMRLYVITKFESNVPLGSIRKPWQFRTNIPYFAQRRQQLKIPPGNLMDFYLLVNGGSPAPPY